jgi:hypothetical protein
MVLYENLPSMAHSNPEKKPRQRQATFCAGVIAALISASGNAAANQICAEIYVHNPTSTQFNTFASVDGTWAQAGGCAAPDCFTNPNGSPPSTINKHQTIGFGSCGNGGPLPQGTGGSLKIQSCPLNVAGGCMVEDIGTLTWSAPWTLANGLGGGCGSSPDVNNPEVKGSGGSISWSHGSMGGDPDTCVYHFILSDIAQPRRGFQAVNPHSTDPLLVLGTDGKLWLEHGPFGNVPPPRTQIDGNVL